MARSSALPTFTIILGLIVFVLGVIALFIGLVHGQGVQLMSLATMIVGLAGVVIGRRIKRKAGASTQTL